MTTGAVRLLSANIGGQLTLTEARLEGADAYRDAVTANGMRVEGDAVLGGMATTKGAVRMIGAHITGQLRLIDAQLEGANTHQHALSADGLCVERGVRFDDIKVMTGSVRLMGAHIGEQLSLYKARLEGAEENGAALVADRLHVEGDIVLDGVVAPNVVVRLPGAHIDGALIWNPAVAPKAVNLEQPIADSCGTSQ